MTHIMMMRRTQIALDAGHLNLGKARAAGLGLSFAAYMRRLLAQDIEESPREADISMICGLGASGRSDISANKGRYIAEAIAADKIDRRQQP